MNDSFPGIAQLLRLRVTDSTQAVARFLAEQGAPEWTLVWADLQTAGRGRLQRRWASRSGGLYFSLVLRPAFPPARLAELSLATAAAAAEALACTGIGTAVKPPNDVIGSLGRRSGKVCGILAEASGGSRRVDWVTLGVGINVNNAVSGVKGAASLKGLTGRCWELEEVLRSFLRSFQRAYRSFR
ncbi:MAG: biotin--[acetyl-CoA-carboxylase] ligase [Elusimicrobia bacterium]|nr:biotin--[acetyl-CoA-carboxylase] ligase [Elusimicrobiota bacterium]